MEEWNESVCGWMLVEWWWEKRVVGGLGTPMISTGANGWSWTWAVGSQGRSGGAG